VGGFFPAVRNPVPPRCPKLAATGRPLFQRKEPPPVCPEGGVGVQCLCQLL